LALSVSCYGQRVNAQGELPVYMDPIEFSQLLAIVHTLRAERCLEWGSGGSTRAVLEACPFIKRWVSVEHDRPWFDKVKGLVTDPRLSLNLCEPDQPMAPGEHPFEAVVAWAAQAEQDPGIMASYVGFPATLGESFDLVLVDGRARRFCLEVGFSLLRPGGVIVLHDAQREQYHGALHSIGQPVFLEPFVQGQIALVRKPG
jgi:hypothetical protein